MYIKKKHVIHWASFADLHEQEGSQGTVHHCVQLEKARRELEHQLLNLSDHLQEEEACSAQLALHKDRLEAECGSLRRDLDQLESALTVAERARQVDQYDGKSLSAILADLLALFDCNCNKHLKGVL